MTRQTTSLSTEPPSTTAASTAGEPTWLRQLSTLAYCEYRLAIRNRWALALVGLFALFGAMLVTFSGSAVGPDGVQRIIASLTTLSVYLVPLTALVFGYDAVVGRRQRGWLELVFSLPVPRHRVVLGTYIGRAIIFSGTLILGFGFVGLMLFYHHGPAHWEAYLLFLLGTVAVGAVFLAMSFVVSALAREKTHALGIVLLLWVWFVFAHDLLALGAVAAFELSQGALTALLAANPATTFRLLVLEQLGATAGSGFTAAFATAELSTGLLVVSLAAWGIAAIAIACMFSNAGSNSTTGGLRRRLKALLPATLVLLVALAGGCDTDDDAEPETIDTEPISLIDSQTCDVCGMVIEDAGMYGPNAQVFFDGDVPPDRDGPAHYDSVREMYVDLFGHEHRGAEPLAVYVTDYSTFDYDIETRRGDDYITGSLNADTFVNADDAVFVINSGIRGAMGTELLPFSNADDAQEFADEQGGDIVEPHNIDTQLVESL